MFGFGFGFGFFEVGVFILFGNLVVDCVVVRVVDLVDCLDVHLFYSFGYRLDLFIIERKSASKHFLKFINLYL